MNTIAISGLCGSDSKLDYTQNGTPILSFSLAYSEKKGTEWTPSEWWSCKLFGKYGEAVHTSGRGPKKGDRVVVIGKAHIRQYQAKDGSTKFNHDILVQDMQVAPKRETASHGQATPGELGELHAEDVII